MSAEEYISEQVRNRGIPVSVLARKTGLNYQPLKKSLQGKRLLRSNELLPLAAYFGLTLDDLYHSGEDGREA